MFGTLGRNIARNPVKFIVVWAVLAVTGLLLAATPLVGDSLFAVAETREPTTIGSDSNFVLEAVEENSAGEAVTAVMTGLDLADPELPVALGPVIAELAAVPGVVSVVNPLVLPGGFADPQAAAFLAVNGDGFATAVTLAKDLDDDAFATAHNSVVDLLNGMAAESGQAGAGVLVSSGELIGAAIQHQIESDLVTGALIALPIALIIMVFVFGGFLAAGMPMLGAGASIGSGLGALWIYSKFFTLDSTAINVITVIGLGLSIDYGLLIVSRFREELVTQGGDAARALEATMSTAGRTVFFSGLTVAISVGGLLVFPSEFLRVFGLTGLTIVLVSVATAITLVPAVLFLSAGRLSKPGVFDRIPALHRIMKHTADVESDHGRFSQLAGVVQRAPWAFMIGALVLLVVVGLPAQHLHLNSSGMAMVPKESDQRTFLDELENYPYLATADVTVLVDGSAEDALGVAAAMAEQPLVERATPLGPLGEGTSGTSSYQKIELFLLDTDAGGLEATDLVVELREQEFEVPVFVGGQAANQLDFKDSLFSGLPAAAAVVILATFILLFLMTGSVLVPFKALITNLISLTASVGILVWIFQDGNLSGLLGFESTGGIESAMVALVIAFAFGLAMDYEVFLLARIKEGVDHGMDNDEAVRVGLQRSGRIITSAALVMVVVFAGFAGGELIAVKQAGFALAIAVFLDATLVRMILVPATMSLLGKWNWWAPAPLRRLHSRINITH